MKIWLTSKKNQLRAHFFHKDGTWKKKGDDNDDDNNDDGGDKERQSYTKMKMLSSPDREESLPDKDDMPAPPLVWWKKAITIMAVIGIVGLVSAGAGMLVYWILLLLLRVAGIQL